MILTCCIFIGSALRTGDALVLWLNKSFALQGGDMAQMFEEEGGSHSTTTPCQPGQSHDHGPQPAGSCGFCIHKGVDRSCFRSPRHRSPQVRSQESLTAGLPGKRHHGRL